MQNSNSEKGSHINRTLETNIELPIKRTDHRSTSSSNSSNNKNGYKKRNVP